MVRLVHVEEYPAYLQPQQLGGTCDGSQILYLRNLSLTLLDRHEQPPNLNVPMYARPLTIVNCALSQAYTTLGQDRHFPSVTA